MGFSKAKVAGTKPVDAVEAILIVPETIIENGAAIKLKMRPMENGDSAAIRKQFLAKTDEERANSLDALARDLVCSMLTEAPDVEDFPDDNRSLTDRAVEYFSTGFSEDVQKFIDKKFAEIYQQHAEVVNPTPFFRRIQNSSAESASDGGANQ